MNYPTNHPFSPRYESQIPVTTSDLRSAAARAFIQKQKETGRSTTNILETGFRKSIPGQAKIVETRSTDCPRCKGPRDAGRKQRVFGGRRQYLCSACVLQHDDEKVSA